MPPNDKQCEASLDDGYAEWPCQKCGATVPDNCDDLKRRHSGDVDEALRLAAWLEKVSASYDPVGPEYLNAARLLRRFAQSSTTECTWSFNGWICRACISLGG